MNLLDAVKTKNIIKISLDDSLSSALSHLSSSHEAAFIFDDKKKFVGVINPYHALIHASYPGNAKVAHCLFHPPHVKNNYSISKVAQLFIESKLHYLPVFNDKDEFIGITSARRLLTLYKDHQVFKRPISERLKDKNQPLLTIYETDTIANALHLFKTRKISKLIMINRDMKLKGVLTYYDLISNLVAPKHKAHKGDREGGLKLSFQNQPVRNFAKTQLLVLSPNHLMSEALQLILDKQIGSVMIVDENKNPIGVITTRDFLSALIRGKKEKKIEISGKDLSENSRHILSGFFFNLKHWAHRLPNVESVKLFVREEKSGGVFNAMLSLIPKKGEATVVKREGKNLAAILKSMKIKRDKTGLNYPDRKED